MKEVNVTEFRNHMHKYLTTAQKGVEVLITLHGRVIARVLPPVNTQQEASKQLNILRKTSKIIDVTSPIDDHWEADK